MSLIPGKLYYIKPIISEPYLTGKKRCIVVSGRHNNPRIQVIETTEPVMYLGICFLSAYIKEDEIIEHQKVLFKDKIIYISDKRLKSHFWELII
mgnify:CR=1 FL=1